MSETEKVKARMQHLAHIIKELLPETYGFTLLAYPFGESKDNEMIYVSNSNREDVVKAMEEWIEKTKDTFGNDTGKY